MLHLVEGACWCDTSNAQFVIAAASSDGLARGMAGKEGSQRIELLRRGVALQQPMPVEC
jgi:hypothetical protein